MEGNVFVRIGVGGLRWLFRFEWDAGFWPTKKIGLSQK